MQRKKIHSIQTLFLLTILAGFAYIGIGLLTSTAHLVSLLGTFGLSLFQNAFGTIALIIVATLAWRPTRMIGSLIATAFLGGTIALMLEHLLNPTLPTVLLMLVWLLHKLNWWRMWQHGYRCRCKVCSMHRDDNTIGKDWCNCKEGCVCEKGTCNC